MSRLPEKSSLIAKVRERGFSGAFLGLALLAMTGWSMSSARFSSKSCSGVFPDRAQAASAQDFSFFARGKVDRLG